MLNTGAIEYESIDKPKSHKSTTKKFLDKIVFTGQPFNKCTTDKIKSKSKKEATAKNVSLWLLSVSSESDEGKNILS